MSFVITYETLFDLLRKEKGREDLQVLPQEFYAEVMAFMRTKQAELEAAGGASGAAAQRASIEFENIKKIMNELYERRERKLLLLALNKARTESAIIDPSTLLPQERSLFDQLVGALSKNKQTVMNSLLSLQSSGMPPPQTTAVPPSPKNSEEQVKEEKSAEKKGTNITAVVDEKKEEKPETKPETSTSARAQRVKFLSAVPKFVGPGMKVFGPYTAGDEAELPEKVANILVKKKRVEML